MEIVGHKKILAYLSRAVTANHISHAYLFSGPKHVGKATVARWFGKTLLCEMDGRNAPCGACRLCVEIEKGIYPDWHYVNSPEDENVISIDVIRQLRTALSKTSLCNSYKIIIIDPVEALSGEAANALLKTLEEPRGKTVFILIAHALENASSTILSRAELLTFSHVSRANIIQALPETYSSRQKEFVARIAMGKAGLAFMMNKETVHQRASDERDIARLLSAPPHVQLLSAPRLTERLGERAIEYTASLLRDILLYKIGRKESAVHLYLTDELHKLGKSLRLPNLMRALNALLAIDTDLRNNVNKELAWGTFLLQLSSNGAPYSAQSYSSQADARPLAFE